MTDDHLQRRADSLAARVEALAQALRAGGISEEASAQLLSHASAAVLQALNLEPLTSGAHRPPEPQLPQPSYCLLFDAAA
jgi:hypothetical protein